MHLNTLRQISWCPKYLPILRRMLFQMFELLFVGTGQVILGVSDATHSSSSCFGFYEAVLLLFDSVRHEVIVFFEP